MLMVGWNFEVDAWFGFWRWNLINICVRICDTNLVRRTLTCFAFCNSIISNLDIVDKMWLPWRIKCETGLFDKGQTQNCAKWVKFWAADPKAEHVGKGRVAMTGEEALSVGREEQTWHPHITHSQPLVTRVIKCWPGLGLPTKEKLAWKRFFQHLQSK